MDEIEEEPGKDMEEEEEEEEKEEPEADDELLEEEDVGEESPESSLKGSGTPEDFVDESEEENMSLDIDELQSSPSERGSATSVMKVKKSSIGLRRKADFSALKWP